MEEMGFLLKKKLNRLAGLLAELHGYHVKADYDFSISKHPLAKIMWNSAIVAFSQLNNDYEILDYQV